MFCFQAEAAPSNGQPDLGPVQRLGFRRARAVLPFSTGLLIVTVSGVVSAPHARSADRCCGRRYRAPAELAPAAGNSLVPVAAGTAGAVKCRAVAPAVAVELTETPVVLVSAAGDTVVPVAAGGGGSVPMPTFDAPTVVAGDTEAPAARDSASGGKVVPDAARTTL